MIKVPTTAGDLKPGEVFQTHPSGGIRTLGKTESYRDPYTRDWMVRLTADNGVVGLHCSNAFVTRFEKEKS